MAKTQSAVSDLLDRAAAAANAGDGTRAGNLFRAVLKAQPGNPVALHALYVIDYQRGRRDEALARIERLLARVPDFAEAHYSRGTMLQGVGRQAEALASFDRAVALRPDHPEALHNRGVALAALGRFDEALASFDRALVLNPALVDAHFGRGYTLFELRRFAEALAAYDAVLAAAPRHAMAHNNRGNALRELGRPVAALASFEAALALAPGLAAAQVNRGNALKDLGRFEAAVASYDQALAITGELPDALNNRGLALQELQRFPEALASFDRAVALAPDHAEHRFNRAFLLLLLGSFADGWREYEWRRKQQGWNGPRFATPEWQGEDVAGKRVFLYSEQGLGDTLLFARFAGTVSRLGATVLLGAPARLDTLLRRLDCPATIVRYGESLPDFDLHLPLPSVPGMLGFDPDHAPPPAPYLSPEPALVVRWSQRLPAAGLRVGIAWQGADAGRAIPLTAFAPLAGLPGVRLISLQREADTRQVADLPPGMAVTTLGGEFDAGGDAFLDAAAVMAQLDLVVTADTAIAHLAGALGRPVWIALRHVPDWRWMLDREDSPWYPTARLFRQRRAGDWGEVFARIASELAARITGKRVA